MFNHSREAQSDSLSFISLKRPFSNFQFVDSSYGPLYPLQRIMSQVRNHDGLSMVFEEIDPQQALDLSQENEDLVKLYGSSLKSTVHRLSFFKSDIRNEVGLAEADNSDFIGYAILKQDSAPNYARSRIYESVILPSRHANNFIHGGQSWSCVVGPHRFTTFGYLYAQQNGATNVCAHVACRTAAAKFHRSGDMTYREMNDLPDLQIDHVTKKLAGRGLQTAQMVSILQAAGARCIVWSYTQGNPTPPPPFQKLVYGSIESGYPAILIFATTTGPCHAIPVFGHTFNEDMWAPNANWSYFRVGAGTGYIPSDSWLSNFIVHDDNWGSNYCVPPHFLSTKKPNYRTASQAPPTLVPPDCIAQVIATLPTDVKGSPVVAEVTGADYLLALLPRLSTLAQPWGRRLDAAIQQQRVVLRPLLIEKNQYLQHLKSLKDWDYSKLTDDKLAIIEPLLSDKIWMVEVSLPELFSANRRKMGEVLFRADVDFDPSDRFANFILARIPGYFVFHKKDNSGSPGYKFFPSGVSGHGSLFRCEE